MLKLFVRWAPVAVVIMIIVNLIASYGVDNHDAVSANFVALMGWIAIAADQFINKKSAD
jgi:hypothetical protein